MAKYIKLDDAELAMKAVCNTCDADDCRGCYINTNGVEELVSNTIGTVQTIEIVRCDDCPHRHMCYREVAVVNEVLTTVAYERVDFCSRGGNDNG